MLGAYTLRKRDARENAKRTKEWCCNCQVITVLEKIKNVLGFIELRYEMGL